MTSAPFTLTPAYGRDYKSRDAVFHDLQTGKDFVTNGPAATGTYANLNDLQQCGYTQVTVRYDNQRKVAVFDLKGL